MHAQNIKPTDISYVSTNPYTNEITVSWYKSESANISFARILYIYDETTLIKGKGFCDIAGNEDFTKIFNTDTISLITFEPNLSPLSFAVDAYAENGENSTSLREYHTTMVAYAETTRCPSQIIVSWSPYVGYNITVEKYQIIESNNNTETIVAECVGSKKSHIISLNETKDRNFFVRAFFTDTHGNPQQATSSMCSISEKAFTKPKFVDIENVSISQNDIELTCNFDLESDYRTFVIYKSEPNNKNFKKLHQINLESTSYNPYSYIDINAFSPDTAVFYKVAVLDECNSQVLESKEVTPLICTANQLDDLHNIVNWTHETANNSVVQYNIWRSQNSEPEELIDSVNETTFSYIDDIQSNYQHNFSQCYRIEAVQLREAKHFSAFSNSVCLNKQYKLLIPNAFNPNSNISENREFKPEYAFVTGDYKMEIFDRFGACIFTSTNIDQGWNGTIKGKNAPTGMYHYKINMELPNSELIERHGIVHLISK